MTACPMPWSGSQGTAQPRPSPKNWRCILAPQKASQETWPLDHCTWKLKIALWLYADLWHLPSYQGKSWPFQTHTLCSLCATDPCSLSLFAWFLNTNSPGRNFLSYKLQIWELGEKHTMFIDRPCLVRGQRLAQLQGRHRTEQMPTMQSRKMIVGSIWKQ